MSRPDLRRIARRPATLLLAAGAAGVGAACNEDFVTGPRDSAVTLELTGWADTVVLGDVRTVRVRVLDAQGREIVDVPTQLDIATAGGANAAAGDAAVLESRLNATSASAARLAVASTSDSVSLSGARPGAASAVVTLLDPRFTTTALQRTATVVVAGVRAATAHDTTLTALGDTSVLVATALARQGTGPGADYLPVPGQGVTWTRRGPGAVRLVGAGDSVRVVAEAAGTDTLIASHARCLTGAHCADTTVIRVAQGGALGLDARAFRAWSLGDSIVPRIVLADARGNAVAGSRVELVPLTGADSALVAVNTTAGVPTASMAAAPAPALAAVAAGPRLSRAVAEPVVRLTTRPGAALTRAVSAAPLAAPPLVAKANGTARVAVRALAADGSLLASDTLDVVVRQIARVVHVAPADADLTPGDSIPVAVLAVDARGHLIPDADFQPAMTGAVYRGGRIVVPTSAAAGQRATLAMSVVGVAQPRTYPTAATADPAPDSARVRVRVPAPATAGDTSSAAASDLTTTLLDPAGRPRAGVWVRFMVPAGQVVGSDSVLTDDAGVARARWSLPTKAGHYTASAVVLAGVATDAAGARADTAGRIVLRRSATVVPGAPATLVLRAALPATAPLGTTLAPAPTVQVEDAYGNAVAQAGLAVAVTAVDAAARGFALGGTLATVTDADGRAGFPDLVGTGTAGAHTLRFTAVANGQPLTPLSAPVTFVAGSAVGGQGTVVLSAPTVASGSAVTVTVTPRDAGGNGLGAGRVVTVALDGKYASGSTLSAVTDRGDGTYTATITGGVAGALAVTATVDGAPLPQEPTLTVTAGAPAALVVTAGTEQTAPAGTALPVAPQVRVRDAAGNPVPNATVTFAAAPGSGVVTGATPTTTAAGLATVGGWQLGPTTGTQTLTAAVAGVAPVTVTATATAGAPTRLVMARPTATLATIGSADTVEAVVEDAHGNPRPDVAVTWTSGTPSAVTVGATGTRPNGRSWAVVTAAAQGQSAVRATAGPLSGITTVTVRQVAADFTVSAPPAPLRMGETTPLNITAVDSGGTPVPRRNLTYTSSDPSIATVDSLGNVRGIGPGTAVITVTADGVKTTQNVNVPVSGEFNYTDFCTLSGLNLSGTTTRAGCALRLTAATNNQAGGVWQPVAQKLDGGFESVVRFRISNPGGSAPGGADGLVFVIQSTSNQATGQIGLGIGYQGLTKALAVELDTWQNSETAVRDLDANHIAVQSCGPSAPASPLHVDVASGGCMFGRQPMPFNLKDGNEHVMRVVYVPGTLRVYFDGSATPVITTAIDLTNVKGGSILDAQGRAWIGFTSATGGAWANHDVLGWSLTPSP